MKRSGQALIAFILLIPAVILTLALVIGGGELIYRRIRLQNATDGAAYTAALWQARGLNCIADLNWALLASAGGETAFIRLDYKCTKAIIKTQDTAKKTFPGAGALAMENSFRTNNGGGKCLPLPVGIKDLRMFSLRLRRTKVFIERDFPRFWLKQDETGPLIRVMGFHEGAEFPLSGLLGKSLPSMEAVASAMPVLEGDSDIGDPLLGDLWIPEFFPRLTAVNVKVPVVKEFVLH